MFPRCSNGKLDKSVIKKIDFVLDADGIFPEMVVVYTDGPFFIEPISKELLEEIISSGIRYQEKRKKSPLNFGLRVEDF